MGIPDDPASLLLDAQQSLLDATGEPEHSDRRRAHAHHAATQASDVLLRPESTPEQHRDAAHVLEHALALGQSAPADLASDSERLGPRVARARANRDRTRTAGPRSVLAATADHPTTGLTGPPSTDPPARAAVTDAARTARRQAR